MKNALIHIVTYEKEIFGKKDNLKSATWRPSILAKPSNFCIIYGKEYISCFSLHSKKLYKHKVKPFIELAKTLWLFA